MAFRPAHPSPSQARCAASAVGGSTSQQGVVGAELLPLEAAHLVERQHFHPLDVAEAGGAPQADARTRAWEANLDH
jgi:hypothetical protein